jgi:hypothetical protein
MSIKKTIKNQSQQIIKREKLADTIGNYKYFFSNIIRQLKFKINKIYQQKNTLR